MYCGIGAGLGLIITLVVAFLVGFGRPRTTGMYGFHLVFRGIVEVVLVAIAMCGLIATAVINNPVAWQMFWGYIVIRGVALILEGLR